jgi:hypothetical protein
MIRHIRSGLKRPDRQFKTPTLLCPLVEKLPLIGPKATRFTRSLALNDSLFRQTHDWQPKQSLPKALQLWAKNSA